ncbi:hypothetical protein M902_1977 [Bacteriovorax sp. BAL6_X]|uniref:hypothetical protein n=1 Tax=Bacteriovorax sp. BAL6_X TaxID=1201290 RepID=UPI000386AED8|nr:hypothetical protein [Bacteriovorax sp. BAL6_X]EPZ52371.1 hypothetical protein M902_1977 [Bacteriovorax sp. BAL6_X]
MLKNLIGHNLKAKGTKEQSQTNAKTVSVDNLLSSHANKKLSKGQKEEFSKLLLDGESKGQKSLQTTNVAEGLMSKSQKHNLNNPVNEKISHQEVRELLKEGKANTNTLIKESHSPKMAKAMAKHTTPTSLISTLSSTEKTPAGKHSDIDSILGTKNIVELQKAKTTLESKQTPKLAAEGVKTNALLGKNTQAIIESAQATPERAVEGMKDNNLLRMSSTNLFKGKKPVATNNKNLASGADFLANRQVLNNHVATDMKASNSFHMNKFAKEASHKSSSIIRMKSEPKAEDFSSDIATKGDRRAPQVQNNLIGALGNTNTTNDFKAEINLGKAPEVLDLSNVSNADQMIKEVTNYIEMNRIENGKSLQVLVKHNELGHFNVTANKDANGMIALNIETTTIEAKEFFKENEVKLLKNLDMKGVRVADFKIHTATSGQMSDTASQSESFKNEKRNNERQADKISTRNMTGNESDYARQLDNEDSFAFDSFQDAREGRQRRWQEYSERIGA